MDDFLQAMNFRHACKNFDASKKIDKDILDNLLEVGRLSPSSFGLEPTRMIVIKDSLKREELRICAWGQKQIVDASEVIIFTSLKADLMPNSNYIINKFRNRFKNEEDVQHYIKVRYGGKFLKENGYSDIEKIGMWSALQAYIMATTIMNYAAFLKIDSCMIEGFIKDDVEKFLQIDPFKEQVTLILCLGFRADIQGERKRTNINELVKYI